MQSPQSESTPRRLTLEKGLIIFGQNYEISTIVTYLGSKLFCVQNSCLLNSHSVLCEKKEDKLKEDKMYNPETSSWSTTGK